MSRGLHRQRLHRRKRVLHSMVQFVDKGLLAILGLLALGDVDEHVDCAHELAVGIVQRRRVGHERHQRPVGSLSHRLGAADHADPP